MRGVARIAASMQIARCPRRILRVTSSDQWRLRRARIEEQQVSILERCAHAFSMLTCCVASAAAFAATIARFRTQARPRVGWHQQRVLLPGLVAGRMRRRTCPFGASRRGQKTAMRQIYGPRIDRHGDGALRQESSALGTAYGMMCHRSVYSTGRRGSCCVMIYFRLFVTL